MIREDCSLLGPVEVNGVRVCRLASCGKPLPKGRRRWCSDEHSRWFATNHLWQMAREERLRLDGLVCQDCGEQAYDSRNEKDYPGWPDRSACDDHHKWTLELARVRKALAPLRAEVNHIVPLEGAGYGASCRHHVDGLETLHHACHTKVTMQQERDRKMRNAQMFYEAQRG